MGLKDGMLAWIGLFVASNDLRVPTKLGGSGWIAKQGNLFNPIHIEQQAPSHSWQQRQEEQSRLTRWIDHWHVWSARGKGKLDGWSLEYVGSNPMTDNGVDN